MSLKRAAACSYLYRDRLEGDNTHQSTIQYRYLCFQDKVSLLSPDCPETQNKLALNSEILCLPNVGIKVVHHHHPTYTGTLCQVRYTAFCLLGNSLRESKTMILKLLPEERTGEQQASVFFKNQCLNHPSVSLPKAHGQ